VTDLFVDAIGPADARTTLIFMHGAGLDHTLFRPFVDPLSADARLVFFDARLNGRSPRRCETPVDLRAMVRDAWDVLRLSRGPSPSGRVVLVAHSFGAVVALALATWFPSDVDGLVLVGQAMSPTIGATLLDHATRNGTPTQRQVIETGFSGGLKDDEEFAAAWETIFPLYFHHFDPVVAHEVLRRIRFSLEGFTAFMAHGLTGLAPFEALPQLKVPVLVIGGEDDWCEGDPSGGSRRVADMSPRATCVMLADCGHFLFIEQPAAFRTAVRTWLWRTSLADRP
jgi:proline iminopeptidase